MFLAVDIGNTDVVFGFYLENSWKVYRNPLSNNHTTFISENIPLALRKQVKTAMISSVVPDSTKRIVEALNTAISCKTNIISPQLYKNLAIDISNPYEIGTDLVANSVAANEKYTENCLIIDFGTALTFTLVVDKAIQGVSIAPGLQTSMRALVGSAAQLKEIPLSLPDSIIGTNTESAIQSGVLWGYVGLVERMIDRIEEEAGRKLKVIATGGLSEVLKPLQYRFDAVDRNLTLEGIRLVSLYSD